MSKQTTASSSNKPTRWQWPPLNICVGISARGSEATAAGLNPKDKSFAAVVDSKGVAAMMGALGWRGAPSEEPALAAVALDALVEVLVSQACMLTGADFPTMEGVSPSEAMGKLDQGWAQAIVGAQPWRIGALASGLTAAWRANIASDRYAGGSASLSARAAAILARHEEVAQACASTLAEQIERLGASCCIQRWSMGEASLPSKLSPKWDWGPMGFAMCIELADESTACAWIPRAQAAKIEKSPLGRAFGPWCGMKLFGERPELRSVFGMSHSRLSYTSNSLGGELAKQYFHCTTFRARDEWRGVQAASSQEAIEALESASQGKWVISYGAPSPEGIMRRASIQAWLDNLSASILANRQAREISKGMQAQAEPPRRSPKRSL